MTRAVYGENVARGQKALTNGVYGIGLNDYAQLTQYRKNAGVDITWYPRKYR